MSQQQDEQQSKDGAPQTGEGGAPRDEELRCAACGHPIAEDDIICPNCGISLAAG